MKILHLFSNWKWTGPAEPALNLSLALKKRGHQVNFACGTAPKGCFNPIIEKAIERGLTPITDFRLSKHLRLTSNVSDYFRLKKYLKNNKTDIIHTHMTNDHLIGGRAAKKTNENILVVRTTYACEPLPLTRRNKLLFSNYTDGLLTISDIERDANITNFNLPENIVKKIDGAIDLKRFTPSNVHQNLRVSFGFKENNIVIGIIARVQWHRNFDILLKAISIVVKKYPNVRLLIIGRGTNIDEIAVNPVKEMGLKDNVIFSGYRKDDYVDVLACMDINIFMVPGSDGSCRAVREALAMGKPVIAANKGILPELVDDSVGLIVEDNAENIAQAMTKLVADKTIREKLGKAALNKSIQKFDLDHQAEIVEQFYRSLITNR